MKKHVSLSLTMRDLVAKRAMNCKDVAAPCFDTQSIYASAPDITDWRVIEHCSTVTQLYAVYEKFVHEILAWYLAYLETHLTYAALDQAFRDEHRRRLGQVLIDLHKDRYKSLNLESVVSDYANAVAGDAIYRLLPDAILSHDQNLRLAELATICDRCGIKELAKWLSRHRELKRFFSEQTRQGGTIDAELKQLIDYRNDAAHGGTGVDAVVAPVILLEYADFLIALCTALFESVRWRALKHAIDLGNAQLCGSIRERYNNNIVVALVQRQKFSVGDSVVLSGEGYCYEAKILSIQDQDIDQQTVTVLDGKELGFRFDVEPIKFADMYYYAFG